MVNQEVIPTINDDLLLVLVTSIQGLTLTLQANLEANAAPLGLATPPPTAPEASTSNVSPMAVNTDVSPPPSIAARGNTVPAAIPDVLPIVPPGIPSEPPGPIPPPTTFGEIAAEYLTPHARSSQGVHPTVLMALPDIINAPERRTWFVVTVGRYTGIYPEWHQVSLIVSGWSGACYKRHPTKALALAAYDQVWIQGSVHGGVHPDHQL